MRSVSKIASSIVKSVTIRVTNNFYLNNTVLQKNITKKNAQNAQKNMLMYIRVLVEKNINIFRASNDTREIVKQPLLLFKQIQKKRI